MTPDRCAMLTAYVRNNRCVVGLRHVTRPSGIQRLSFISESFNLNETVTVERKRKSETVKLDIFPAPWNNIPQILIGSEKRKLRVCNVPILLLLVTYCRRPFTGLKGGGGVLHQPNGQPAVQPQQSGLHYRTAPHPRAKKALAPAAHFLTASGTFIVVFHCCSEYCAHFFFSLFVLGNPLPQRRMSCGCVSSRFARNESDAHLFVI